MRLIYESIRRLEMKIHNSKVKNILKLSCKHIKSGVKQSKNKINHFSLENYVSVCWKLVTNWKTDNESREKPSDFILFKAVEKIVLYCSKASLVRWREGPLLFLTLEEEMERKWKPRCNSVNWFNKNMCWEHTGNKQFSTLRKRKFFFIFVFPTKSFFVVLFMLFSFVRMVEKKTLDTV